MSKLIGLDPAKMAQNIEFVEIDDLIPYEKNSRVHKKVQVDQIADSIIEFGFTNPILISDKNGVIAGHGRLMAARKLKLEKVPVIRLDYLTDEQQRAYVIADNKIAENAEWNFPILAQELHELEDINFDLSKLGFSVGELDDLLNFDNEPVGTPQPKQAKELPLDPIVKQGDIWVLGDHRLKCGNPTDPTDYEDLTKDQKINMLLTKLQINDIANPKAVFSDFISIIDFADYNTIYCMVADKELHNLRLVFEDNNVTWSDYLIWLKSKPEHHSKDYDSMHELIAYGWKGKHQFYGSAKSCSTFEATNRIELAEEFLSQGSKRSQIVYDAFAGDGSVLIACETKQRKCFAMEMKEKNCDAIINAWQEFTRQSAFLESTGETYDELAKQQSSDNTRDSQEA